MLTYLGAKVPQLDEPIVRRSDQHTQVVQLEAVQCFYSTNVQSNNKTNEYRIIRRRLELQSGGRDHWTDIKAKNIFKKKQVYIHWCCRQCMQTLILWKESPVLGFGDSQE